MENSLFLLLCKLFQWAKDSVYVKLFIHMLILIGNCPIYLCHRCISGGFISAVNCEEKAIVLNSGSKKMVSEWINWRNCTVFTVFSEHFTHGFPCFYVWAGRSMRENEKSWELLHTMLQTLVGRTITCRQTTVVLIPVREWSTV